MLAEKHEEEDRTELAEKKVAKSVGHMLANLRKQPVVTEKQLPTIDSSQKPKFPLVPYDNDSEDSDDKEG